MPTRTVATRSSAAKVAQSRATARPAASLQGQARPSRNGCAAAQCKDKPRRCKDRQNPPCHCKDKPRRCKDKSLPKAAPLQGQTRPPRNPPDCRAAAQRGATARNTTPLQGPTGLKKNAGRTHRRQEPFKKKQCNPCEQARQHQWSECQPSLQHKPGSRNAKVAASPLEHARHPRTSSRATVMKHRTTPRSVKPQSKRRAGTADASRIKDSHRGSRLRSPSR